MGLNEKFIGELRIAQEYESQIEWLKKEIESNGLRATSRKVRITHSTISRLVNGEALPKYETMLAIAEVMDTPCEYCAGKELAKGYYSIYGKMFRKKKELFDIEFCPKCGRKA